MSFRDDNLGGRAVEMSLRQGNLSWSRHYAVTPLEPEEQER
jgi:hypothetical protein